MTDICNGQTYTPRGPVDFLVEVDNQGNELSLMSMRIGGIHVDHVRFFDDEVDQHLTTEVTEPAPEPTITLTLSEARSLLRLAEYAHDCHPADGMTRARLRQLLAAVKS